MSNLESSLQDQNIDFEKEVLEFSANELIQGYKTLEKSKSRTILEIITLEGNKLILSCSSLKAIEVQSFQTALIIF